MSPRWLLISLALLTLQVITFAVSNGRGRIPEGSASALAQVDAELLADTLAAWEEMIPLQNPAMKSGSPAGLLGRETSLLKLADLEKRLHEMGVEAHFAGEARNWAKASEWSDSGGGSLMDTYLRCLVEWCALFLESSTLEKGRVQLVPGTTGEFPEVIFEVSGSLRENVDFLQGVLRDLPDWRVEHLDLNQFSERNTWWIQGRYCFWETVSL